MRFVQHPSNNRVLGAPEGWDQEKQECGALPVTDTVVEGHPVVLSFWEPSAEDRAAIAAGARLRLFVWGRTHAPVAIDVEAK